MKSLTQQILRPTLGTLASCLLFLGLAQLPAFADHIHHLWYNNSNWQDIDLTALTNGGIAKSFGAITAFRTTPNNQLHVYYVDQNSDHVHQLYFNNTKWSDDDLTAFTGGLPMGLQVSPSATCSTSTTSLALMGTSMNSATTT
jgi:hypothetical protein